MNYFFSGFLLKRSEASLFSMTVGLAGSWLLTVHSKVVTNSRFQPAHILRVQQRKIKPHYMDANCKDHRNY